MQLCKDYLKDPNLGHLDWSPDNFELNLEKRKIVNEFKDEFLWLKHHNRLGELIHLQRLILLRDHLYQTMAIKVLM
jgi:hypothetical protein